MDVPNLSPSGMVLPLASSLNGNHSASEQTGVMQAEGGSNRTIRIIGGLALATTALTSIACGIAASCTEPSSQEYLGLGVAAGVLGGLTALGAGLAMKFA
ncbi:type III secretion system protein SepZ [Shigella flexneri]